MSLRVSERYLWALSVMHITMLARLIVMCITEWAQRYLSDN